MPKYALLFIDAEMPEGQRPSAEDMKVYQDIGKWFETNGSRIESGKELQGGHTAKTVRLQTGTPIVTDGPFIESKEVIGGFAVVDANDLDDAVALAKTWPARATVEVRPCVEDH